MKNLTEQEIILESQANLYLMENSIRNSKYSLEEFSELGPGRIHINWVDDIATNFISRYADKKNKKSTAELIEQGAAFVKMLFKPDSFEFISQPLIQMVKQDDETLIISILQKVKLACDYEHRWLLVTSRFQKESKEVISVSQMFPNEDNLVHTLNKLLKDNIGVRKNINKFNSLTKREKQILKLVAKAYSTKQIAEQLFLSPYTISTHRKNIKQKLQIQSLTDWQIYADALETTLI